MLADVRSAERLLVVTCLAGSTCFTGSVGCVAADAALVTRDLGGVAAFGMARVAGAHGVFSRGMPLVARDTRLVTGDAWTAWRDLHGLRGSRADVAARTRGAGRLSTLVRCMAGAALGHAWRSAGIGIERSMPAAVARLDRTVAAETSHLLGRLFRMQCVAGRAGRLGARVVRQRLLHHRGLGVAVDTGRGRVRWREGVAAQARHCCGILVVGDRGLPRVTGATDCGAGWNGEALYVTALTPDAFSNVCSVHRSHAGFVPGQRNILSRRGQWSAAVPDLQAQ